MTVSIDIGTSYSSICILGPDGKAQPVDISTGASMFGSKYSLPSAVFVEDSGDILVGQAALNSRKHKPQNFRMEFKRNLGEEIPILLGGRSFMPEDLYTELFRHMKARAENVFGGSIGRAYLTYPASYGEKRQEKLRSAARAAGIFDLELVDEPTAAAMCYCAEGYVRDGQKLLVYDFGGGTFDAALIHYQGGKFRILTESVGLERCGGADIDYLIAKDMQEAIEKEAPEAWDGLKKNRNRFMRFTSQMNELAIKAKHHLSDAKAFEEYIEVGMDDVHYSLDRQRFNQMVSQLAGQTVQACRLLLENAGMSPSDLSAILLVGGTSRIPLVQEMAGKIMGKAPLCVADLELSVVQGALLYEQVQKERERREAKEREEARKEAEALEKSHKAAEDERTRREAEAEKARREAAEAEKAHKEEDTNLFLGRSVEKYIAVVESGRRLFVPIFPEKINYNGIEERASAKEWFANYCGYMHGNMPNSCSPGGLLFTHKGIFSYRHSVGGAMGWQLYYFHDTKIDIEKFTSWNEYVNAEIKLLYRYVKSPWTNRTFDPLCDIQLDGNYIAKEVPAIPKGERLMDKDAFLYYEFFTELQEHLRFLLKIRDGKV